MAIAKFDKAKFIDDAENMGVLEFGERRLKSGRMSPYFFNVGNFSSGRGSKIVGDALSRIVFGLEARVDVLYGPAYKGICLVDATARSMFERQGYDIGFAFNRKEVKIHGEGTGKELQSQVLIGRKINDDSHVAIVEDVFTSGDTKYEALDLFNRVARGVNCSAIVCVLDRQEVDSIGRNAAEEFRNSTGIRTEFVIRISDVYERLMERGAYTEAEGIKEYLTQYGTGEVQNQLGI